LNHWTSDCKASVGPLSRWKLRIAMADSK
jgi:hypothetical protein